MEYSSDKAADALAFIDESRARLAAADDTPPARHLAFAAVMGGIVASPALPVVIRGVTAAFVALAVVLIVQWDRRRTGMFINGYRAGRTRWVTAGMLAVIMPLYGVSTWFAIDRHAVLIPVILGAIATPIAFAGSVWWCRVFRREMLSERA
jgi:hypothetical protein